PRKASPFTRKTAHRSRCGAGWNWAKRSRHYSSSDSARRPCNFSNASTLICFPRKPRPARMSTACEHTLVQHEATPLQDLHLRIRGIETNSQGAKETETAANARPEVSALGS